MYINEANSNNKSLVSHSQAKKTPTTQGQKMKFVPNGKFSRARTHAQVKDNRRNLYGSSNSYYDDDEDQDDYRDDYGNGNGFDDRRYGSSRSSRGMSHGGSSSGGHRYGEANVQESLKDIINSSENRNRCGECQATFPTWCSVNLGIFLCGRCASVHRKLLNNRSDDVYSDLKSVSLDRWTSHDLNEVRRLGGNKGNSQFWNPKGEQFPFDGDDDKSQVETFIRDKYISGRFKFEPVRPEDFGNAQNRRNNSNSGSRNDRNRDRSDSDRSHYHSRPSSRTNSREEYDNTRNGSVTTSAERNPQLPKRRPTIVGGRPAVFDGTSDMVSQTQVQAQATGMPQQYLDPATGIIYVDQQQQAAALQQQQAIMQQQALAQQQQAAMQQQAVMQQQAMAQQQAAMQQQVQKNSIMNLYQRPDLYTTPVEITNAHPLYNQMTAQQQQQQQQQVQQQQAQQQQYYTGQPFM